MKNEKEIKLTSEDIKNALKDYDKNLTERYKKDEELLKQYVNKKLYRQNEISYVYFISTLINSFYSTRMGNDRLFEVAKYITQQKNIQDIENDIYVIVREDKKFKIDNKNDAKKYSAYSFLSKYFAIHNRLLDNNGEFSEYPIYDSRVFEAIRKIISDVKKNNKNTYSENFKKQIRKYLIKDIKNYEKFCNIYRDILNEVNRNMPDKDKLNLTDLDHYFWTLNIGNEEEN